MLTRILILCLIGTMSLNAQPNVRRDSGRITPEMYIDMFKEAAITDMKKTGVPASITLAQGMYESDYGNSPLATNANNHFGIKCHKEWEGPTYHKDDDAPNECFRKYESVLHSYDDHSDFLRSRDRYSALFTLEITDYKGWSHGLKKAGYATNPGYASKLIGLIEKYRLHEYDVQGSSIPVADAGVNHPVKSVEVKSSSSETKAADENKTETASAENTVNGIPVVYARKGDTWTKLARENNIELWQVLEFNDAAKNDILRENEMVFIKAKKNKAEQLTHICVEGDTMRGIAQQYGVKLSKLYRMNEMNFGDQPEPGTKVYLKRAMLFGVVL
ncbi:MAG: glucosaminidase domain-containing protein [Bacteroidetes bacterium]|nr:glucosaminidase domain-containing protein [Bacteroidota bacterium]